MYRAEHQAYQKRKGHTANGNGSIDADRECTSDKRSVSED